MAYRWKPNALQRREFAQRMSDPQENAAYKAAKEAKAEKRRAGSKFDYTSAGGEYIPTQAQYHFVSTNYGLANTPELREAFTQITYGYTCQAKIPHDYIHVINELIRAQT